MKQTATVAKVVNPLGTVVTIQSDEEATESDVLEDAIIHENCDEALFRPVVAPKAIFYSETKPKNCSSDHILTKSLDSNTEVTVKIINHERKGDNKIKEKNNKTSKHIKSREASPKAKKDNKAMMSSSIVKLEVEKKALSRTENRNRKMEKLSLRKGKSDGVFTFFFSKISKADAHAWVR